MEWFLINQNEHLGPFDEEILHDLYHEGEILKDSLVWREGWTDAKSYEDVFLLEERQKSFAPLSETSESVYDKEPETTVIKDEDLPPDLPPEVTDFKTKIANIKSSVSAHQESQKESLKEASIQNQVETKKQPAPQKQKASIVIDEEEELEYELEELKPVSKQKPAVPDSPEDQRKMAVLEESEKEINVSDIFEYDEDVKVQERKLSFLIRITVISLLTLVIFYPLFLYITDDQVVFSRPQSMSLEDYEKLIATANDPSKDLKFSFALATDRRTLWISTNISLEGEVFVNLKSKVNRVLGGQVEIKAKGILEKKLIRLTEFQFIQGTRFVQGYYDAELYTVEDLSEPFYNKFFDPREKQFRYLNDVLITDLHPAEFEKALERRNQEKRRNQSRFWDDLAQEYKTVRGMTIGIKDALAEVFDKPVENWEQNVAQFEATYKNNFGVLFTGFILSTEKQYDSLMRKQFPDKSKIIGHYAKLKELATDIGKKTVESIEKLKNEKVSEMTREQLQDLKFNSLFQFKVIVEECDDMIEKL